MDAKDREIAELKASIEREQKRKIELETKLAALRKENEKTKRASGFDLPPIKEVSTPEKKITDSDKEYISDIQKIASTYNVSMEEAEKIYSEFKNKAGNTPVKKPKRLDKPTGEQVEIESEYIERPDLGGIEAVKEEPAAEITPENVVVEAKPGLKDTMVMPEEQQNELKRKLAGQKNEEISKFFPGLSEERMDDLRQEGNFKNGVNVVVPYGSLVSIENGRRKVKKIANLIQKFKEILGRNHEKASEVAASMRFSDDTQVIEDDADLLKRATPLDNPKVEETDAEMMQRAKPLDNPKVEETDAEMMQRANSLDTPEDFSREYEKLGLNEKEAMQNAESVQTADAENIIKK